MYFYCNLEPVCCSCLLLLFLTCMKLSQGAGNVFWYSHLLKSFLQFVMIHIVKGFSIVNEAEVDIFLEFSCFFYDPMDHRIGNLISGSAAFSKSSLNIWKFSVHVLLKLSLENFGSSDNKEPACNAGDPGLISESEKSPREGNGYPVQYSCLENPMDRGAWWAIVHGLKYSQTRLSD